MGYNKYIFLNQQAQKRGASETCLTQSSPVYIQDGINSTLILDKTAWCNNVQSQHWCHLDVDKTRAEYKRDPAE